MRRWLGIIVVLVVILVAVVWRLEVNRVQNAKLATQRAGRSHAAPSVDFATAKLRDIENTYTATGSVDAPLDVDLAAKVAGRIEMLQVHEGDPVKKGQVLVRLDPSQIEATVLQAQAALADARFHLTQAQLTQTPTDVNVETQIDQQQAGVDSAMADLHQAVKNYDAQIAAAQANVNDAQTKVASAQAGIENARATIISAQANCDDVTAKLNRTVTLYNEKYEAAQDVDDAKAAVAVQVAAVAVAQGQLKSATATYNSTQAELQSAEQQENIVKTTGQASIDDANAKLKQARASLKYAKSNNAQKPAYGANLASLRAEVDAAKANLENAQAQRADTVLISPLDGFVTKRYMDPGAMANVGTPLLGVQFVHSIWVTIAVPEEVYVKLHVGQPSQVTFDALPAQSFTAKILQLNPAADPTSRQFTVRVVLDNSAGLFKPGMFAKVILVTERVPQVVTVPREAVLQDTDGSSYVMTIVGDAKNQTVVKHPVVLGASDTDFLAITSGVDVGDKLVTMSTFPVKDGQKVRTGTGHAGGASGGHGQHGGATPGGPGAAQ